MSRLHEECMRWVSYAVHTAGGDNAEASVTDTSTQAADISEETSSLTVSNVHSFK